MTEPTIYEVDHEARLRYLTDKLKTNTKLAQVVHSIIDFIHMTPEGKVNTYVPEQGPIVIFDNRQTTRDMVLMKYKKGDEKGF